MNSTAVLKVAKGFFPLFYLVSPSQSSFKHLSEVPDYVQQVSCFIITIIWVYSAVQHCYTYMLLCVCVGGALFLCVDCLGGCCAMVSRQTTATSQWQYQFSHGRYLPHVWSSNYWNIWDCHLCLDLRELLFLSPALGLCGYLVDCYDLDRFLLLLVPQDGSW